MDKEHLDQAIDLCNNGDLTFNLGPHFAFLYNKKWYPLRATILSALIYAKENVENFTVREALWQLAKLGMYVRLEQITFQEHRPISINQDEIIEEISLLRDSLSRLID